ncbi:putative serine/threonine-protein kinase-like protein CCR3 isoform X2 [Magnolia sinica]|uniref:putative serine/threonine-protein kinase-like protein CCR3 isoform X2 n=1 Tax=Magnolia sinica TaxID=86752 RepID=UPI00265ADB5E|nr:putative serine/threonine-protein kinase-like protein CCR3 isoform X2 [Magnolia sinica]
MTIPFSVILSITVIFLFSSSITDGLGSSTSYAVCYDGNSSSVCGIVAGKSRQSIQCFRSWDEQTLPILSTLSFDAVSGGRDFFCGLRSGGLQLICWDSFSSSNSNSSFQPKRIYNGPISLRDLSVGDDHVCAVDNATGNVMCWRGGFPPRLPGDFHSITSGQGFSCGIHGNESTVRCWGDINISNRIQTEFGNTSMVSLVAGDSHVCGIDFNGLVICKGRNESGQLNVPSGSLPFEFSGLALEANRSCAIRQPNGTVICWGGGISTGPPNDTSFVSIVSGSDFTCGLLVTNLSMMCWGSDRFNPPLVLPLPKIVPGQCTEAPCSCGVFPDSGNLCSGSGHVCQQCINRNSQQSPPPLQPTPTPLPSTRHRRTNKGLLAFAIVGAVGTFFGICTIIYCLWTGICCCRQKKIHNSVQPTIAAANTANCSMGAIPPLYGPGSRSSTFRRQSSRAMRRQRSGTSSMHADRAEEFTLSELAAATDDFSPQNKIGAGSFGTVYRGKLADGREVAIKRGETGPRTKKFQEKENAFQSELAFLSRLHHKHLVGLVGFCEEYEERLLVYDYMKNGALYDHLHTSKNNEDSSDILNSWKMRIKISLDASRGIEYLHTYAVPPIIHRDIKSSNILIDANWIARVSDFGLSLKGPESDEEHLSMRAAGTVGYMDPEYYGLQQLTAKSDVYGFGVVLLELLTGKRAIFKDEEGEAGPTSVVDYAVPRILAGELAGVLDRRVGMPELNEAEAVELVAYTAVHCVNLEGKERPTMADIVANLERALALCQDSHGVSKWAVGK